MARYQCPVCGYIYDEEKVGAPFSPATFSCPICGVSGVTFVKLDDDAATSSDRGRETNGIPATPEAAQKAETSSDLSYPSEFARTDPAVRHMDTIHEMALTGKPIIAAMGTQLPLPSWDDILILGAQLDPMPLPEDAPVDISTTIGPRAGRPMHLDAPIFVSHMSFGALSASTKEALAKGAAAAGCATCSGEGGMLEQERSAAFRYIFEYVPNLYSVTDDNLRSSDAVEIKIGQGTKPGMGGHLPAGKVTPQIAAIRNKPLGHDIISPSRFPGIDTRDDLKALVEDLRKRSDGRPIGIKIAAGHIERDLAMVVYAGADFVTIDGRGGATGASPKLLRDATSVPTIYALSRARTFLDEHDPQMSLVMTGGFRVSSDIAKALAMGADAVAMASAMLMAAGCQQYRICGSGKCPVGIATQDPELGRRLDGDAAARRVANFLKATEDELVSYGRITGHADIHGLTLDDLVTTSREIAEGTSITFA